MKMLFLLLFLFVVSCLVILGCQGLGPLAAPHSFQYTQKVSCTEAPTRFIPIWVDRKFGEADRVTINDAVGTWNHALNGYLILQVVDFDFDMESDKVVQQVRENGWLFLSIDSKSTFIPPPAIPGHRVLGFVEHVGGHHLYLVRDRLENSDIFGVMLHEMGHLLGATHQGNKLMFHQFSRQRFACIDQESALQAAMHNHLPPDRMNYCVEMDTGGSSREFIMKMPPISIDEAKHPVE